MTARPFRTVTSAPADVSNPARDDASAEGTSHEVPVTEQASRILTEADHADRALAGRILEEAMLDGRCSQEQLALAAGINRSLVSRMVSGEKRLGTDKLVRLAKNPRTRKVAKAYGEALVRLASKDASKDDGLRPSADLMRLLAHVGEVATGTREAEADGKWSPAEAAAVLRLLPSAYRALDDMRAKLMRIANTPVDIA